MLACSLGKGNLINAKCALAAPPHYPPLVEPLRPGPTLVPPTPSNPLTNLLSVSPTPAPTLLFVEDTAVAISESALGSQRERRCAWEAGGGAG